MARCTLANAQTLPSRKAQIELRSQDVLHQVGHLDVALTQPGCIRRVITLGLSHSFRSEHRPDACAHKQEFDMHMNKDQIKGRVRDAEGNFKEHAGTVESDAMLKSKSKNERILGGAQAQIGDIKQEQKDAKKAVDSSQSFAAIGWCARCAPSHRDRAY